MALDHLQRVVLSDREVTFLVHLSSNFCQLSRPLVTLVHQLWQSMSSSHEAEKLTLPVADNKAGYFGVSLDKPGQPEPYKARVRRGGKNVSLGYFTTAEEAALCIARSPEGKAAAEKAVAAPPLRSEEARQHAQAERLTLPVADTTTGYFGVTQHSGRSKPYQARVMWRGGKKARRGGSREVGLGNFATAEEFALCFARAREERHQAAPRSAAAPPLTSEDALQQARDAIVREAALDIIHQAAGAATAELSAEVAVEVMAGIAMGL